MKKVGWCLWLVLAMPSMALSADRGDGTYYCTVKFVGGIAYNKARKEWQAATFKPSRNFVIKLSFRETTKLQIAGLTQEYDEYDVAVTADGKSSATPCLGFDGKPPSLTNDPPFYMPDQTKVLTCGLQSGTLSQYEFNVVNHRFLEIYTAGYVDGGDDNSDTPAISGGLCSKVQ
jgi:hypothetical protein